MTIRRREFITLLGGAAVGWPIVARAQRLAIPVVGLLTPVSLTPALSAAIRQGLGETGYVEGRNVAIEHLSAEGQFDRLPALAAELVRRRAAVILTPGSRAAAEAAKAATTAIPVVFSFGSNPVQAGLVPSFNRPGGNVTGFSEMATETAPKRLGIMHELIPRAVRFAFFFDPAAPPLPAVITDLQAAASAIGGQVDVLNVAGTMPDIKMAVEGLGQRRPDAILVNPSPRFYDLRAQFALLAARHAVPAIYWDRAFPDAGGLMSYGSSVEDLFRQVGVYAGRILKGEKAGDLPVQQAAKFELVINLKTTNALGLTVPPNLLATADEVIE
jgi:putative tryptophan/tyrosine transport system substrate-binding protein